jgi:excisionase family DNA binding protein
MERSQSAYDSKTRLLTVADVALMLGIRPGTARLWIAQRRLPVVRLGRSVRIPMAAVTALIERNTIPARPRREVTDGIQ